jgi:hypothetical protein
VVIGGLASAVGALALPRAAKATLLRGLSLEALSATSGRIVYGSALEASSHWEVLGGHKRIVTDTRVRVDDVIAKAAPDQEILVRTLGGTMGDLAAMVYGEALLVLDEPCVLFLSEQPAGVHRVVGMAQGHYPVRPDLQRAMRLKVSPRAPELLGDAKLAVHRLPGQELSTAASMIREALSR